MKKIVVFIRKLWFAEVSPQRLAVLRMATGGFTLWYLISRFDMLSHMVENFDAFEPTGVLGTMQSPIGPEVFRGIMIVLLVLNILFILGWKFRYTGPAFAILTLVFFTYRNSWSMIYHNRNALVLHILILGLVASADAWSLDAWKRKQKNLAAKTTSWRYGWPIMLISAVTVGSYLLSGIAKVAGDLAWEWANGNAMRSQIAVDALRKSVLGAETAPLFDLIYEHTWLFLGMGILTFFLELGAPLALLRKRWGKLWALFTFGMHWGIFFTMGIAFRYQMTGLIFLSFLEPEKWFSNAKKRQQNTHLSTEKTIDWNLKTRPVILFDGLCNLCNGWVRFVLKNEQKAEYRFASLQSDVAKNMLVPFKIEKDLDSIVLIENDIMYRKSEAVLRILERLKFPWPVLGVFIVLPHFFRDVVYDMVAKNRYAWFGKREQCALMSKEEQVRFLS